MLIDDLDKPFHDTILVNRLSITNYDEATIPPQDEDTFSSLSNWVQPTEYASDSSEFKKHVNSHLAGTNQWVLHSTDFEQWHSGHDNGILWVRGIPGTGKSVLAARLIQHLSQEPCPVLYFFFRHTIESNHRPEAALRDWIAQILPFSPSLQLLLKDLTSEPINTDSVDRLTIAELWHMLRLALKSIPKAYCVVDALDEMDQESLESFSLLLDQLGSIHPDRVKLIITSRPIVTIEKLMRNLRLLDIRLDKTLVEPDISIYLSHRLTQSAIPEESHREIAECVLQKADGLFLYAKLAMDTISQLDDAKAAIDALKCLPTNLFVVYRSLLNEHLERAGIPVDLQILILQLVTHATRPLRLLEISDVIKVTQPQHGQDIAQTKSLIRRACGSLLEVLPDETVRVVHHSLTEYLLDLTHSSDDRGEIPVFEPGSTHNKVALLCIEYLNTGLDTIKISKNWDYTFKKTQDLAPFTQYAVDNWYEHVRKAVLNGYSQEKTNAILYVFLMKPEHVFKMGWLMAKPKWSSRESYLNHDADLATEVQALLFATTLGLESFIHEFLTRDSGGAAKFAGKSFSRGLKLDPPLHIAARGGHSNIVRLLVQYGADPNLHNPLGYSALHEALQLQDKANRQNVRLIEALLECNADPWMGKAEHARTDGSGHPPIQWALLLGNSEVARLFLPYITGKSQAQKALAWAIRGSQEPEVVRMILNLDLADINFKHRAGICSFSQTPLFMASIRHAPRLISVLLEAGADPNVPHVDGTWSVTDSTEGYNVIHALTLNEFHEKAHKRPPENDTKECFRLLLEAGADVHQTNANNMTALHMARSAFVVQCLLDAGADVNAMDAEGEQPLHLATDIDVVHVLLTKTDLNAKNQAGQTLLLKSLASQPNFDLVYRLLEIGADPRVADRAGNVSIHYLVRRTGHMMAENKAILRKLIKGGADPSQKNKEGQTPLHTIGYNGRKFAYNKTQWDVFLNVEGVDINAIDDKGRSPLFAILESWDTTHEEEEMEEFVEMMAKAGARLDATDEDGRTLLHAAVSQCRGNVRTLQHLAQHGVEPKVVDLKGNTIWHEGIVRFCRHKVSTQFLDDITALGADLTVKNKRGRLPLHLICEVDQPGLHNDHDGKVKRDRLTPFEYVIRSHPEHANEKDEQGVTPLHSTSTFSTNLSRRLLDAGADATIVTHEGLNVLHLAARSRQSNTIGLVIDWLKSKASEEVLKQTIDAQDKLGRTPLYYACASGRYESVQRLIEAGATVGSDRFSSSVWDACTEFEEEQLNWRRDDYDGHFDAAGVLIEDNLRLKAPTGSPGYRMERINEILQFLVVHAPLPGRRFIDLAIAKAVKTRRDYTVECLVRARQSLLVSAQLDCEAGMKMCLGRRAKLVANARSGYSFDAKVSKLMANRLYDEVVILVKENPPKNAQELDAVLTKLTRGGFISLLDAILTTEMISEIEQQYSSDVGHIQHEKSPRRGTLPLLFTACQAAQSNMAVVKLLLQRGSNVNVNISGNQAPSTVLHLLVSGGERHYWQVSEALPYLLQQDGVDLEIKDDFGRTPLNASLEDISKPSWNSTVVFMLLEAGADANAVDKSGKSCLGRAIGNQAVMRMILQHGAVFNHSSLASAIHARDTDLLRIMLESGADPNKRNPGQEIPFEILRNGQRSENGRTDPHSRDELYPLDLIMTCVGRRYRPDDDGATICRHMIEMLLEHGADPNARYPQTTVAHRSMERRGSDWRTFYAERSQYLNTILQHPRLNVNLQDEAGVTLLFAACVKGDVESADILLGRGVNIRGVDNAGKNVLHCLLAVLAVPGQYHDKRDPRHFMRRLLELAPELLHEVDKEGNTPLHIACTNCGELGGEIATLVAAGARVTAENKQGDTPLHFLFEGEWVIDVEENGSESWKGRRIEMVDLLLIKGAKINARNKAGETPIYKFFRQGSLRVDLPMSAEAFSPVPAHICNDPWAKPEYLETCIVTEREPRLWALLEQRGVDWHEVNLQGQSLLHVLASMPRRPHMVDFGFEGRQLKRFEFLLNKGLDALKEDKESRTALDLAAANNGDKILALFSRV